MTRLVPVSRSQPRPRLLRPAVAAVVASIALVTGGAGGELAQAAGPPPLPVPKPTVDPQQSIGGPRLASMGLVTDLPAGVPAPPRLRDVAWVLADLDTGDVVAAQAAHARFLPASTLKTLTALALIPKVPATRVIVASPDDANADGTRVGIVPGQPYTAASLFQALLMSSGNDAAYALARAAGGREATLAAMNEEAAHLGAYDTLAKDPSGLDVAGQTSSAYDLALIGRAALQLKDFRTYVTTKQADFPGRATAGSKRRATFKINNHNRLLYNYPGTIGVKNGYTEAAHHTFISAVTRGDKTYVLTEMYGLDTSWRPQAAVYDWAFRYGSRARPVGTLVAPGTASRPSAAPNVEAPGRFEESGPLGGGGRHAAAAALAPTALLAHSPTPWAGVGGLAATAMLLLVLAGRARALRLRRARHTRR